MVLSGKLVLAALCWLTAAILVSTKWWTALSEPSTKRWACLFFAMTRGGVFLVLFGILDYDVPSDVAAAYYPEALAAMAGKLVYRDIWTTYAPFFPYIAAAPLFLWKSSKAIVLLAIAFEFAGFLLWFHIFERRLEREQFRRAVLLYVFSPLLISTVALTGQNHVWVSPFLALSLLFLYRHKSLASGLWAGLLFLSTKFFSVLFLPGLFVHAPRRVHFVAGSLLLPGIVLSLLALAGSDVLYPLYFQRAAGQESSGNVPYLLSCCGLPMTSSLYVVLALATLAAGGLLAMRTAGVGPVELRPVCVMVFCFAVGLLLSKKSYTTYWAACGFPLIAIWVSMHRGGRGGFHLFQFWGLVAALEPSLYFRWMKTADLSALAFTGLSPAKLAVFVVTQVLVVSANVWFLWLSYIGIRGRIAPAENAPAGSRELRRDFPH